MSGKPVVTDDPRIIAARPTAGLEKTAPSDEDIARRIAASVTATAGGSDPGEFMDDVQALRPG